MTKDEALTLEALKYAASKGYGRILREMKIAPFIIKSDKALAQPAQEPVAWSWVPSEDWGTYFTEDASKAAVMRERGLKVRPLYTASSQPAQEPVAWISPKGHIHFDPYLDSIPLYAAPHQRPWVGLTEPEQPVGSSCPCWAPGNELTSIEKLGIAVSDFIGEHNLMWSDALVLAWQEAEADYVDELNNAINQGSDLIRADERDKYEAQFKKLMRLHELRESQPNKPCCLAEREACALICDEHADDPVYCGAAIRARGAWAKYYTDPEITEFK